MLITCISPSSPFVSCPAVTPHQALAHLYQQHHGWLRTWLQRRLGHAGDAADFAQDTYVRVMESRTELSEIREPRAFLTTVAKRVMANHLRRREIERAYMDTLALQPEPLAPSPEERAIVLETLCELDRLLDGLPPKVRAAFLHAQLDGMAYAEIALLLQVSVSSVKQYMARAIRHCYFPEHAA
ncbi:sigma-70 family RNA polymerase sigma factor [Delftia acidovorans]|uniref:sigma-70 family RNA polymerase sigma factor n=1 Tax=Delftia acidovorans TaxID=80866 RepID=UPI000BD2C3D3|nr:sigma-70 family RNA polymerase sigma factor [Delftia acidovorans]SOE34888.1 RNA polymerase sigma-70 factor, ECF subfamily [Delftia acidovorans]